MPTETAIKFSEKRQFSLVGRERANKHFFYFGLSELNHIDSEIKNHESNRDH